MRGPPRSHGSGEWLRTELGACPDSVVIEPGVLIFHPERVFWPSASTSATARS
jgi:hypothetical protein